MFSQALWIEVICLDYLEQFVQHTKCSVNNPVMLIMDNHGSRISLAVAEFAKENGECPITLYPHTSHKLYRRTAFGDFKRFYFDTLAN